MGQLHRPILALILIMYLSTAFKEAESLKDEYVSTEHLLIALLQSKGVVSAPY
jgi:ATP-dependent Clp protease ATP-binding subunit ClpA